MSSMKAEQLMNPDLEDGNGIRELTEEEILMVSGGDITRATVAFAAIAGIGASTWGGAWGAVMVGAAILDAPIAVAGMVALGAYGGYQAMVD